MRDAFGRPLGRQNMSNVVILAARGKVSRATATNPWPARAAAEALVNLWISAGYS